MIADRIIQDVVSFEISNLTDAKLQSYGYDVEKLNSEGSAWIVYIYDCFRDYYRRNKKRIDRAVNRILEKAKIKV